MRVITGTAKGTPLAAVPGTGTRPTTDKMKEALFSIIGPYFDGGRALDLFAGTGGLGIEALSRGMERCVFIDVEPRSIAVIRSNLAKTGLAERSEVYRNDYRKALKRLADRGVRFDLVLLDPPYRMKDMDAALQDMQELELLAEGATVAVEHDASHRYPDPIGRLRGLRHAEYGDSALTIYHYEASAAADREEPDDESRRLPGEL